MFRAYDTAHGRWLNRDPIGELGGINLYGYVNGNPINRIDPLGLVCDPSAPPPYNPDETGAGDKANRAVDAELERQAAERRRAADIAAGDQAAADQDEADAQKYNDRYARAINQGSQDTKGQGNKNQGTGGSETAGGATDTAGGTTGSPGTGGGSAPEPPPPPPPPPPNDLQLPPVKPISPK